MASAKILADPTQKREHHARRNTTRADPIPHGAREGLDGRDPLAGRGRTARPPRRALTSLRRIPLRSGGAAGVFGGEGDLGLGAGARALLRDPEPVFLWVG